MGFEFECDWCGVHDNGEGVLLFSYHHIYLDSILARFLAVLLILSGVFCPF
jgi:hypothetical protein